MEIGAIRLPVDQLTSQPPKGSDSVQRFSRDRCGLLALVLGSFCKSGNSARPRWRSREPVARSACQLAASSEKSNDRARGERFFAGVGFAVEDLDARCCAFARSGESVFCTTTVFPSAEICVAVVAGSCSTSASVSVSGKLAVGTVRRPEFPPSTADLRLAGVRPHGPSAEGRGPPAERCRSSSAASIATRIINSPTLSKSPCFRTFQTCGSSFSSLTNVPSVLCKSLTPTFTPSFHSKQWRALTVESSGLIWHSECRPTR